MYVFDYVRSMVKKFSKYHSKPSEPQKKMDTGQQTRKCSLRQNYLVFWKNLSFITLNISDMETNSPFPLSPVESKHLLLSHMLCMFCLKGFPDSLSGIFITLFFQSCFWFLPFDSWLRTAASWQITVDSKIKGIPKGGKKQSLTSAFIEPVLWRLSEKHTRCFIRQVKYK